MNTAWAIDARTGREIWRYRRELPANLTACCGLVNRGFAALGDKLFMTTLDAHLLALVQEYGVWIYAILFAIIFCETGLVVTPFLPGDSLLFVAGAIAATGAMDVNLLVALLVAAAFAGDFTNYSIGRWLGTKFFTDRSSKLLNPEHLEKAHAFYERHGGKAIIIARFMPIVRTFVPVVAGVAKMPYRRFALYNIVGGASWVLSMTLLGYWGGHLVPDLHKHIEKVIILVVLLSIAPGIWQWAKLRLAKKTAE